ncbi:hypothetical protein CHELA20_51091 [Hyphomicrobiales bacterium]|nr:hypothetical protein CHELA20_51091 [Hyphomicrobiales bacterium]
MIGFLIAPTWWCQPKPMLRSFSKPSRSTRLPSDLRAFRSTRSKNSLSSNSRIQAVASNGCVINRNAVPKDEVIGAIGPERREQRRWSERQGTMPGALADWRSWAPARSTKSELRQSWLAGKELSGKNNGGLPHSLTVSRHFGPAVLFVVSQPAIKETRKRFRHRSRTRSPQATAMSVGVTWE